MRCFILGLLSACCVVQSAVLQYPQQQALLAYSPSRGEFPVQGGLVKGYTRYVDNNGVERVVEFNYPEPLQGQRRLAFEGEVGYNPLLKSTFSSSSLDYSGSKYYQQEEVAELVREREEHFRTWCEQRLSALKAELQLLRSQGQKPSADILAQIKPLETIVKSTSYESGFIAETPEVQKAREEHLRLWNEARLRVLQLGEEHGKQQRYQQQESIEKIFQTPQTLKINNRLDIDTAVAGETAEQKKAREEHLRIYNQQVSQLKQIQTGFKQQTSDFQTNQGLNLKTIDLKVPVVGETAEQKKAREEHLRIYNEQIAQIKNLQTSQANQAAQIKNIQTIQPIQLINRLDQATEETEEQKRARAEHLRIYNEQVATLKKIQEDQKLDSTFIKQTGSYQQPLVQQGQVQETAEVLRAKEEHLRLWNEAKLKAEASPNYQPQQQPLGDLQLKIQYQPATIQTQYTQQINNQPIADTPEVIKAREEHLKLVNEAKLKAQTQTTPEITPALRFQPILQQPALQAPLLQSTVLKTTSEINQYQQEEEAERQRDNLRIIEEKKLLEQERLREEERQRQEKLLQEQEEKRLRLEEERRIETERIEEQNRLRQEQLKTETIQQAAHAAESNIPQIGLAVRYDAPSTINTEEQRLRLAERLQEEERLRLERQREEQDRLRLTQEQHKTETIQQGAYGAAAVIKSNIPQIGLAVRYDAPATINSEEHKLRLAERLQEEERLRLERQREEQERLRLTQEHHKTETIQQGAYGAEAVIKSNIPQIGLTVRYDAPSTINTEEQRLRLAERLQEEERLRLERQREEQERLRLENERLQTKIVATGEIKPTQVLDGSTPIVGIRIGSEHQPQQLGLPGYFRYTSQGSSLGLIPSTGIKATFVQQIPSTDYYLQGSQNPYLQRYVQSGGAEALKAQQLGAYTPNIQQTYNTGAEALKTQQLETYTPITQQQGLTQDGLQIKGLSTYSSSSSSSSNSLSSSSSSSSLQQTPSTYYGASDALQLKYGQSQGLSELEKATREHFKAHDLALEQLRLANLRTPHKDC